MEAHHAQATAIRRSGDLGVSAVSETRKLAAILVSDIVGYSRLAGADEDRILARLRTLRSDLIDPTIAVLGLVRTGVPLRTTHGPTDPRSLTNTD
jgi:class 3 adenylate cyclase